MRDRLAAILVTLSCTGAASGADLATREPVVAGLDSPSNIAVPPDGSGRIVVTEAYEGLVRVVEDGRLLDEPFLSVSDRLDQELHPKGGLLSIAFPPDFPTTRQAFVTYTARDHAMRLSRFGTSEDGRRALPETEEILVSIADRPFCGHQVFGRDGLLYFCAGDLWHGDPPARPRISVRSRARSCASIPRHRRRPGRRWWPTACATPGASPSTRRAP